MKTINLIKLIVILALQGLLSFNIYGQDPQFSQLYANPLFLNPARAGYEQSLHSDNAGINARGAHRIQWPQLSSSFVTSTGSIDAYDESTKMGIGLAFIHDQQGDFITQQGFKGFLSYHIKLNDTGNFLHFGMDVSNRWMNYSANGLLFIDQLSGGGINTKSIDPLSQSFYQTNYFNAGVGGIFELRTEDNKLFFLGVSVHNLARPNLASNKTIPSGNQVNTSIPLLAGLELGYQKAFHLANKTGRGDGYNRWSSLSGNAYLKIQGQSMQLDLGLTYNFDQPFMVGISYRGIPIRKYNDIIQQDALVGMFGIIGKHFTLKYSYDVGISTLTRSGGSHEVVLSATFGSNLNIFKNRSRRREMDCLKWQN
jgi:type IX secretion system PorP/SprF family membrane protein